MATTIGFAGLTTGQRITASGFQEARMNSRERVLKTLRRQEPDRVPLDSGGSSATTIAAVPYSRLKRLLGVGCGPVSVYEVVEQLATPWTVGYTADGTGVQHLSVG